jgi:hypothetical protein
VAHRIIRACVLFTVVTWTLPVFAQEALLPSAAEQQAAIYTVQLVPFAERTEAQAMLTQLTAKGYQAFIYESARDQAHPWYAVRMGRYVDLDAARQALIQFKRSERMPAFITPSTSLTPLAAVPGENRAPGQPPQFASAILPTSAATAPSEMESSNPSTVTAGPSQGPDPDQTTPPSGASDLQAIQQKLDALNQKVGDLEQEAEARKILRMSEEEQAEREKEILSAAGREYTLIPKGRLGVEYNFQYDYMSSDVLEDLRNGEGSRLAAERRGNHTLTNTILMETGLRDNLTVNGSIPYVYKYDTWGQEEERQVTDLGDVSLGLQYQPVKASSTGLSTIVNLGGSFPTGRSPYKIDPNNDLATGGGCYTASAGLTFSKTLDPVVAFGNLNYTYRFRTVDADQRQSNGKILTEIDPSDSIGFSLGMGYALSHKTSLNLSYQYAFHMGTDYKFDDGTSTDSGTWISSMFSIGAGWRLSPRYSLFVRTDIGLTNDDPDFSFSMRIPVQFDLGE